MPTTPSQPRTGLLAHPVAFALAIFVGTAALALAGIYAFGGAREQGHQTVQEPTDALALYRTRPVGVSGPLDEAEERRVAVVAEAARSVVHIRATQDPDVVRDQVRYQGLDPLAVPPGTGSGVIWNKRGYIVTNAHLIDLQTSVTVQLHDGSRWRADYVGALNSEDLAVLCIGAPADRLVPVQLGMASELAVGQSVYALGNPFGLDLSLTVGVVSGLGRETKTPAGAILRDLIQTDAAINPGNSGGPLLDSSGAMIGLNSSIPEQTTTASGIGFAVPTERINQVVPQLILAGIEPRWELGIKLAGDNQSNGLLDPLGARGVVVLAVDPDGPADGLLRFLEPHANTLSLGDAILAVDGQLTPDRQSLTLALEASLRAGGDSLELEILRCPSTYSVGLGEDGRFESKLFEKAPEERLKILIRPARSAASTAE